MSPPLRRLPTWYVTLPGWLFFDDPPPLRTPPHDHGPLRSTRCVHHLTPRPDTRPRFEVQLQAPAVPLPLTILSTPRCRSGTSASSSRGVSDVYLFGSFAFHVPVVRAHKASTILARPPGPSPGPCQGVLHSTHGWSRSGTHVGTRADHRRLRDSVPWPGAPPPVHRVIRPGRLDVMEASPRSRGSVVVGFPRRFRQKGAEHTF